MTKRKLWNDCGKRVSAFILKAADVFDNRRILSNHLFVPSAYEYTRKATSTEQRVENMFKDAVQGFRGGRGQHFLWINLNLETGFYYGL